MTPLDMRRAMWCCRSSLHASLRPSGQRMCFPGWVATNLSFFFQTFAKTKRGRSRNGVVRSWLRPLFFRGPTKFKRRSASALFGPKRPPILRGLSTWQTRPFTQRNRLDETRLPFKEARSAMPLAAQAPSPETKKAPPRWRGLSKQCLAINLLRSARYAHQQQPCLRST